MDKKQLLNRVELTQNEIQVLCNLMLTTPVRIADAVLVIPLYNKLSGYLPKEIPPTPVDKPVKEPNSQKEVSAPIKEKN